MSDRLYQCAICKLHYRDKKTAQRCELFCGTYNACSLEIAQLSIENQKRKQP